jgi:hypothetical protein
MTFDCHVIAVRRAPSGVFFSEEQGGGGMMIRDWLWATAFIAVFPGACIAGEEKWAQASSNESGALYYDAATVKNDGQFVSLTVLNDFKEPTADGKLVFRSIISRQIINCANNIVVTDYYAYRSGPMGTGDVVYSSEIKSMQRVVAGSVLSHLVKLQCDG